MNELAQLDESALAELRDVMEDDFDTLVQTFLADSRSRIQILGDALAREDAKQIAKTAHSFKGSCINMGAPLLSDCCSQVEQAAKVGELSVVEDRLPHIEQAFAEVERLLSQL